MRRLDDGCELGGDVGEKVEPVAELFASGRRIGDRGELRPQRVGLRDERRLRDLGAACKTSKQRHRLGPRTGQDFVVRMRCATVTGTELGGIRRNRGRCRRRWRMLRDRERLRRRGSWAAGVTSDVGTCPCTRAIRLCRSALACAGPHEIANALHRLVELRADSGIGGVVRVRGARGLVLDHHIAHLVGGMLAHDVVGDRDVEVGVTRIAVTGRAGLCLQVEAAGFRGPGGAGDAQAAARPLTVGVDEGAVLGLDVDAAGALAVDDEDRLLLRP